MDIFFHRFNDLTPTHSRGPLALLLWIGPTTQWVDPAHSHPCSLRPSLTHRRRRRRRRRSPRRRRRARSWSASPPLPSRPRPPFTAGIRHHCHGHPHGAACNAISLPVPFAASPLSWSSFPGGGGGGAIPSSQGPSPSTSIYLVCPPLLFPSFFFSVRNRDGKP